MPWCPVCHAEYRAGVRICRRCQAALVNTPPKPGEHYTPPAGNVFDTMAETLARSVRLRAWGRQFVEGVKLFGESFRLMRRMRNLWLVLAVLTGLSTVAAVQSSRYFQEATAGRLATTSVSGFAEFGARLSSWWWGPFRAISHVSSDLRSELETPVAYGGWLYGRLYLHGWAGQTAAPHCYDLRLLGGWLILLLIDVLFFAGVLWWVLLAVRGEEQTAARFWEGVRRSFWLLLAWEVVYGVAYQVLSGFALRNDALMAVREALFAAIDLAVLPLVFTSKVIVVQRPPVYRAPAISARIFARRFLVILGFAVPFIVLHDLLWGLGYAMSPALSLHRVAMPVVTFVMQLARVAVELAITTAFVILVARWDEANRVEPAQPEAAA